MRKKLGALLLVFPFITACSVNMNVAKSSASQATARPVSIHTAKHATQKKTVIPNYSLGVPRPAHIRGIYVSAYAVSDPSLFQSLLHLVDQTSLNTMVIDMKIDNGAITFATNNPELKPYSQNLIAHPKQLMATLKAHHIYPIARIAVFEDTAYADAHPQDSYLLNGKPWIGRQNQAYTNPFLPSVWKYNVDVAKAVAKLGFEQIQFDFVRFPAAFQSMQGQIQYGLGPYQNRTPTDIQKAQATYQTNLTQYQGELSSLQSKVASLAALHTKKSEKTLQSIKHEMTTLQSEKPVQPVFTPLEKLGGLEIDAVTDFVKYADEQLKPYHVDTSVDIFGYTATIPESLTVGQSYPRISNHVDVISPMIYPSLWGPGYFGLSHPDLDPYQTVIGFMKAEQAIMKPVKHQPRLIPWIQDYTASYLGQGNYQPYTATQVDEQIQALAQYGIHSYLIWDPNNVYSPGI